MEGPYIPTKEMDVYAFGSTLYMVRLTVAIMTSFLREAHATLLEGLHGYRAL